MKCLSCEGDLSKLQDSPKVYICRDCYELIKKHNLNVEAIDSLK